MRKIGMGTEARLTMEQQMEALKTENAALKAENGQLKADKAEQQGKGKEER